MEYSLVFDPDRCCGCCGCVNACRSWRGGARRRMELIWLHAEDAPSLALDLPLRILVREEGGGCRLSCRDACALAREHGLDEHDETVGRLNALLRELLQGIQ